MGRRARTASRVLPLLGVVLATATGCGFLNALAHPPAPDPEPIAAATPTDFGDVGIFVESNDGDQVYCTDSPPLPTRDRFFNQAGARAITAWVVLGRAVTPATPDGRPEVFPTLQLRISDLRQMHDATTVQRRLVPGALGIGAPCADDARAICVPLG